MRHSEIEAVVELETQAFSDYDYFTYYFPDAMERERVQKAMIRCEYRTNFNRSCCLVAEENGMLVGSMQLNPPTYREPSNLSYILHGWLRVYLAANRKRIDAWLAMNKLAGEPCHAFAAKEESVWYVSALTVSPKVQGTGIGTRFLNAIEERARKAGGKWLTLYTNSENNKAFYCRRGFEVFDERTLESPTIPIKNWSLKKAL